MATPEPNPRPVYRRRHRIGADLDYQAVFSAKCRSGRGPLTVWLRPTDRPEHRLGLSIGRRVGKAHDRVRLKRRLREVFRQSRADLPRPASGGSYDIVVAARAHPEPPIGQLADWFTGAVRGAHRICEKRTGDGADTNPGQA